MNAEYNIPGLDIGKSEMETRELGVAVVGSGRIGSLRARMARVGWKTTAV